VREAVQQLLIDIEGELKRLDLWQSSRPSAAALESQQPFAMDTLEFHQWLQFIMLPRLQALIDGRHPLPKNIAVSPMATHVYRHELDMHYALITHIQQLDMTLSGRDPLAGEQSS